MSLITLNDIWYMIPDNDIPAKYYLKVVKTYYNMFKWGCYRFWNQVLITKEYFADVSMIML